MTIRTFGMIGLAGAGKDAFGEVFAREMGIKVEKFAGPLKEAAAWLFGPEFDDRDVKEVPQTISLYELDAAAELCMSKVLTRQRTYSHQGRLEEVFQADEGYEGYITDPITISPRKFQQLLGTDVCRYFDGGCFTRRIAKLDYSCLVTDCRFENELAVLERVFVVVRPGVKPVSEHISEKLATDLTKDAYGHKLIRSGKFVYIHNDGTLEQLQAKARLMAMAAKKGMI